MRFVVVNGYPNRAVFSQQLPQQFQPRIHHGQPFGVLQVVIIMFKGASRVVWRINVDALHGPSVVGQQGLQGIQIITLNEHVARGRVAMGVFVNSLQQPIGREAGKLEVGFAGQPVQGRHVFPSSCAWGKGARPRRARAESTKSRLAWLGGVGGGAGEGRVRRASAGVLFFVFSCQRAPHNHFGQQQRPPWLEQIQPGRSW